MTRFLVLALTLGVGGYVLICVVAFVFQRRMVYFPGSAPPPAAEFPRLAPRDVWLTTADGLRLHAWQAGPAASPVVLVCHGNAGDLSLRADLAQAFVDMGFAVLLFDYRGYGHSEGSPDEEGTYVDAVTAYDHLRAEGFAPGDIVVYGESLGAAVAAELALRREVAGIVLDSAFLSVPDIGAHAYPLLPVRWLARIRYDNRRAVPRLRAPLLVVHSPQDEVIPFAHGQGLFDLAPTAKDMLVTEAGHNDGGFLRRPAWRERLRRFVAETTGRETAPSC